MSDKRLDRLLQKPKDFSWDELVSLLRSLGYSLRSKKGGSYRRFIDDSNRKILLHEPHPQKVLKAYAIEQVIENLKEHGKI
ncbi:type II toxin-antitoxin system HicA family toxin [Carnimonas bestiolae]|uniref:type II toxin-antitoxin system HicA family toxin n=1 Tax=Carnimonas bestiolae TaxID=3402172 RepID=UPI003EDBBD2A